jgi:hypothetical protein
MSVRLQEREESEPQRGVAPHAASTGPKMIVGNLQQAADVQAPVMLDRRLRNKLLLANLIVWILIIAAVRWLFF